MNSVIVVLFILMLSPFEAISIIYRHDVDSTEYIKLGENPDFNFVGRVLKIKEANDNNLINSIIFHNGDSLIFNGTCQLISENWVISAAHLFEVSKTKDVEYEENGLKIQTMEVLGISPDKKENYRFEFGNDIYEVDTIIYHPKYFDTWKSGYVSMYDVALIKLKKSVKDIKPVKIYEKNDEVGLKGFCVGYGFNGNAYIKTPNQPRKLAGENVIDTIWSSRDSVKSFIVCDFDMSNNDSCNKTGSAKPLNLECTITGGDSGSGFISKFGNNYYLVGISPAGGVNIEQMIKTGYYCHNFYYVRTSIIKDWIKNITKIK